MSKKQAAQAVTDHSDYDSFIAPRNPPQLNFPTRSRPETTKPNTLRIYKSSPETVALQLRMPKHFAHVNLNKHEALSLARELTFYAEQCQ